MLCHFLLVMLGFPPAVGPCQCMKDFFLRNVAYKNAWVRQLDGWQYRQNRNSYPTGDTLLSFLKLNLLILSVPSCSRCLVGRLLPRLQAYCHRKSSRQSQHLWCGKWQEGIFSGHSWEIHSKYSLRKEPLILPLNGQLVTFRVWSCDLTLVFYLF